LLFFSACGAVTAFAPLWLGIRARIATGLAERNNHDTTLLDRRNLIQGTILVASGILLPALAEVQAIGVDPAHPIVVIGAGGKVRFEFTSWGKRWMSQSISHSFVFHRNVGLDWKTLCQNLGG
jgi:hypothetical protein